MVDFYEEQDGPQDWPLGYPTFDFSGVTIVFLTRTCIVRSTSSSYPIKVTPTLFKVVFHIEVVCQKIQHVPLVMLVTFFPKNIG